MGNMIDELKDTDLNKGKPTCGTPNCDNEAWIWLGGKWRCSGCVVVYKNLVNKSVENMIIKEKEGKNE